jgi:hypothetical protein
MLATLKQLHIRVGIDEYYKPWFVSRGSGAINAKRPADPKRTSSLRHNLGTFPILRLQ